MQEPLTTAERLGAGLALAGLAIFGTLGLVTGASGTSQYLAIVSLLGFVIHHARRQPLPDRLAVALGVVACTHLAGGLVHVGDSVLYNADPGTELLQYDHPAHALATFVATMLVWELYLRPLVGTCRRGLVLVGVLAGLGLGAVNEMVEFLSTLVQDGSHVGGYENTGWDLVTNAGAGVAAGLVLRRSALPRSAGQQDLVGGCRLEPAHVAEGDQIFVDAGAGVLPWEVRFADAVEAAGVEEVVHVERLAHDGVRERALPE
ncbi:MAG: hypothetical protein ACSLFO_10450 [Acidimicrobiales bacterium]